MIDGWRLLAKSLCLPSDATRSQVGISRKPTLESYHMVPLVGYSE